MFQLPSKLKPTKNTIKSLKQVKGHTDRHFHSQKNIQCTYVGANCFNLIALDYHEDT